jgi:Na+-driven multidrug efflux pump
MMVPAFAIAIGEAFHLALSPVLILGWGPFSQHGIVGAALAALSADCLAVWARNNLARRGWRNLRQMATKPYAMGLGAVSRFGDIVSGSRDS